jgi:hypothetical protein
MPLHEAVVGPSHDTIWLFLTHGTHVGKKAVEVHLGYKDGDSDIHVCGGVTIWYDSFDACASLGQAKSRKNSEALASTST